MDYPGFIGSSRPSQSPVVSIERTVNWYPERGPVPALLPTPGLASFAMTTDVGGRALFSMNDRTFAVVGTGLWELTAGGTATNRGTVTQNNNKATISYNGVAGGQLFITSGGNGYCYVLATNILTQVLTGTATMGGMKDGYFLAFNRTTGRVALSALNDGTSWDPTQYFARSIAPDPIVAMVVGNPEIWMIGEQTSEAWYNSGAFPQPFAPILSSFMQAGTGAPWSVCLAGDAPLWVGQTAQGSGRILRVLGYTPRTVSDYAVATALSTYERTSSLTDAESFVYTQEGHTFAVISFPTANGTWVVDLDTGDWHERGTWNAPLQRYDVWRPRVHCQAFGKHLVADRATGTIATMDVTTASELNGGVIRRLRIPPPLRPSGLARLVVDRFELQMDTGIGLITGQGSDPQVMLRTTQDGRTWGSERWASGGAIGDYTARVFWTRNGQGTVLWAPEVTCADPVPWRLSGADVMGSGFAVPRAA